MEVIFHGIFTLIKLAILGSIYATLTLLIFRLFGLIQPNSWANSASKKKFKLWFLSGATISIGLILFAMTHWGNHELGDSARIPLQHGKAVNQINGNQAYIEGVKYQYGDLWIDSFAKTSDYLVGTTNVSPVDDPLKYFVWNLKINSIEYFETKTEYEQFAVNNNLPLEKDFKPFWEHYSDFWNGWRFWVLL